jgi:hypothetical protein
MLKWMLCLITLVLPITACSGEREDMKSPCVGTEDSPCGPRRAVNDWWLA